MAGVKQEMPLRSRVYWRIEHVDDWICDQDWTWDRRDRLADALLALTHSVQVAACLVMGHRYFQSVDAYGPRRLCSCCWIAEPGTLIRRYRGPSSIARRWPLPPRRLP